MKLSTKFLQDYVDISNISYQQLAEDMTNIGNEYDSASPLIKATNLVIGQVLKCKKHPDSDHLHITLVDIGLEKLQIVCGASNVKEGQKVIVAKVGANLGDITIKKGNIRGVESNGMLCALFELGLDKKYLTDEDLNGICVLNQDAKVGENPIKYLGLDDNIIDFELTSNRGDLLSILGMSYEIGALYNKKVKEIETTYQESGIDLNKTFKVKVETSDCSLFLAKKVTNVTIKESPRFIKERLIASGIRPINNVVDISNFVMLETGQPLHFYDANTLGNELIVRNSQEGEKLLTLDNVQRTLTKDDIVIATSKKAIGLAGVMGGLETEITNNTKDIIIESAIFNNIKIRMTSKRILRSEASNRFEKGLDPNRTYLAIDRCCYLLTKYANATIQTGLVSFDKTNKELKEITITYDKINKVLGLKIPKEEVITIFKRLDFKVIELNQETLKVIVPTRRLDITIKEDLIEEIGRFYGLQNIIGKLPTVPLKPGKYNKDYREIKHKMAALGLNECLSYALINQQEFNYFQTTKKQGIKVLAPMTEEHAILRYSLLPSLINIYNYNKSRGINNIHIFEMGNGFYYENGYQEEMKLAGLLSGAYYQQFQEIKFNFYDIKGIVETLLDYLGYQNRYSFEIINLPQEMHPYQSANIILNGKVIGIIGKINPSFLKDDIFVFEISIKELLANKTNKIQVSEFSKYPSISKDVAFLLDKEISSSDIIKEIKRSGGKLLKQVTIFDYYEGEKIPENQKSLAFKLIFTDFTKTLTDNEVMELFNKIILAVTKKFKAKVRDK